jgi:acyl-CoA dehydrogenase
MPFSTLDPSPPASPFYSEEHEEYRDVLRRFVANEITPFVHEWDEAKRFPRELYEAAGAVGMLGAGFPEQYGGLGDDDPMIRFIIHQEASRCGSGGVVASLVSSFYISQQPILLLGSEETKARVLPETVSGRKIGALCITEPGGGSDVAQLTTTARRDGDEYVVNGAKTFITSGMRADYLTVAVRTGDEGMGGVSLLLIEGDTPGLERIELDKMGWKASDTATLYFDDCRVPAANLLGEEGTGFRSIVTNFNYERLDLIAQSAAFSYLCVEAAIEYGRERETFGKPLVGHQVIRHKIAEMARQANATQAWAELLAWRLGQGDDPVAEICQAKVQGSKVFEFCAREAAQVLGGASYLNGDLVERLYREVRVQAIGGGSEEIMLDLASRQMGL